MGHAVFQAALTMHERLLIVGAGDFGREILSWTLHVPPDRRNWEFGGFLDDRPDRLDGYNLPARIIGSPKTHVFTESDCVVVALPDPAERRAMVERVAATGARFTSIIHPTVTIGLSSTWGVGCIFGPNVHITTNVRIGDHVIIDYNSGIGHDGHIGSFCTLGPNAGMMGGAVLEESAVLSLNATLVPQARVGQSAIVGPGSVVLRQVDAGTMVLGVPARKPLKKTGAGDPAS
jgi:sugar O-acyltransferase (sialic acid O-acetyltransferase NeuD family)